MKIWKTIATFLGVTLVLATVIYFYYIEYYQPRNKDRLIFKTINEEVGAVMEYARTPEEWARGLSGRENLGTGKDMLFIFPQEQNLAFFMKDVNFPLDIIFINKDSRIVDLITMQPCKTEPCPIYTSRAPAQYVAEVNANFAQRNGFGITDQVILPEGTSQ